MSQNTERLSDEAVQGWADERWYNPRAQQNEPTIAAILAQEVQASRKLVADLRGTHRGMRCCELTPCHTITMIDRAGL